MRISIIHPSRGRPEQAVQTKANWLRKADDPKISFITATDWDDPEIVRYKLLFKCELLTDHHKSAIEAINHVAKLCSGDLLVVISDDFDCPEHWDTLLLKHLEGRSDFCVKTQDGFQKTMMTLPIMDRAYYNRFGYIYHPDYQHMYADKEMTAVAHMLGRNIDVPLTFIHNHYLARRGIKDDINIKNDKTYNSGRATFNDRRAINFGLKDSEIVKPYSQISWR